MTSESNSNSYQSKTTLFIDPSSPMVGADPDPFQGGIIINGIMLIPPIIISVPSNRLIGPSPSGSLLTAHCADGSLPTSGGPIPATMVTTIPPFIPGGSGPSTSISTIPNQEG